MPNSAQFNDNDENNDNDNGGVRGSPLSARLPPPCGLSNASRKLNSSHHRRRTALSPQHHVHSDYAQPTPNSHGRQNPPKPVSQDVVHARVPDEIPNHASSGGRGNHETNNAVTNHLSRAAKTINTNTRYDNIVTTIHNTNNNFWPSHDHASAHPTDTSTTRTTGVPLGTGTGTRTRGPPHALVLLRGLLLRIAQQIVGAAVSPAGFAMVSTLLALFLAWKAYTAVSSLLGAVTAAVWPASSPAVSSSASTSMFLGPHSSGGRRWWHLALPPSWFPRYSIAGPNAQNSGPPIVKDTGTCTSSTSSPSSSTVAPVLRLRGPLQNASALRIAVRGLFRDLDSLAQLTGIKMASSFLQDVTHVLRNTSSAAGDGGINHEITADAALATSHALAAFNLDWRSGTERRLARENREAAVLCRELHEDPSDNLGPGNENVNLPFWHRLVPVRWRPLPPGLSQARQRLVAYNELIETAMRHRGAAIGGLPGKHELGTVNKQMCTLQDMALQQRKRLTSDKDLYLSASTADPRSDDGLARQYLVGDALYEQLANLGGLVCHLTSGMRRAWTVHAGTMRDEHAWLEQEVAAVDRLLTKVDHRQVTARAVELSTTEGLKRWNHLRAYLYADGGGAGEEAALCGQV